MLLYNFILAFRNLQRQQFYAAVNILGFALGIAVFFFISVYIIDQYAYDRWIPDADRIYRLEKGEWAATGTAYGPFLVREFPEVETMVRISSGNRGTLLQHGQDIFSGNAILFADSTVFDIIAFPFIEGDPATALREPNSIVLTRSLAETIFGTSRNVVGKTLRMADRIPVQVTGVIHDIKHFHLSGNALAPFHLLPAFSQDEEDFLYQWGSWNYSTFVKLVPGVDIAPLEEKINDAFVRELREAVAYESERDFFLRPIKKVYFANDVRHEPPVLHGNLQNVRLFLAIAIFILLIAIVNFVNLSTARATLRAREVGIRRLLGSHRTSLILQFLTESVVITGISVMLALVALEIGLPAFNRFAGSSFHLGEMQFYAIAAWLVASTLFVGILSGIYPSLYLSTFLPAEVIKGGNIRGKRGAFFRKVLIVFQFVISISLITATLIMHNQLRYMQEKDAGVDMENTLVMNLNQYIFPGWDAFKNKLMEHPGINGASLTAQLPGTITWQESADPNGTGNLQYTLMPVSAEYPQMMGIEALAGSLFSRNAVSEQGTAVLLNEQAVTYFGYEGTYDEIVGKSFTENYRIVGVVRDFHYNSLHNPIGPLVILWDDDRLNFAHIKLNGIDNAAAIRHIETTWQTFCPSFPFEYRYLSSIFMARYDQDKRLGNIFMIFSAFAIMIACLGLFGLASFMAERRLREMAIRKVMGASMKNLVTLLLKEYTKLVVIAFVIAAPISFYLLTDYLDTFPYQTNITPVPFIIALIAALAIAIITVSYHAIRVSHVNPGKVLKYQ